MGPRCVQTLGSEVKFKVITSVFHKCAARSCCCEKKAKEEFSKVKTHPEVLFLKSSRLFLLHSKLYFYDFSEPNDIKLKVKIFFKSRAVKRTLLMLG